MDAARDRRCRVNEVTREQLREAAIALGQSMLNWLPKDSRFVLLVVRDDGSRAYVATMSKEEAIEHLRELGPSESHELRR